MKRIKYLILTLGLVTSFGLANIPLFVNATVLDGVCPAGSTEPICKDKDADVMDSVKIIVNTLLFVLGAVAVLVLIIAGIMYVVSGGDAASVKKAKDMILYAVVGIVVAVLAYAIVNFVISSMNGTFVAPAPSTGNESTTPVTTGTGGMPPSVPTTTQQIPDNKSIPSDVPAASINN